MAPRIVIITGPTASGKSGMALSVAESLGGVIINADSQQLYHELRILTARPSEEEEARVPHRLYGVLPVYEAGSAGKWLRLAKMEIDWALSQGKLPIIVGGTGLYIKTLMQGMAEIPDIDPAVSAQAANDYEQMGKEAFAARLQEVDPGFFERLTVQDKQRLVRAYAVWLGSGKSLSFWQAQGSKPFYPKDYFSLFQVDMEREALYARCDARFAAMLEAGALEEVKQLISMNLSGDSPAMKSVGIKELSAYLRGEIPLQEAVIKAQQATRNFAKRQLTWMRHQLPEAVKLHTAAELLQKIGNTIDRIQPKH